LVIALGVKNALQLAAVNDAAARLGLRVGMALADAKAMYPALTVADADPDADRSLLEAIADWGDRYTPLIGLDPPDGLMLDITGCAHLFGGEAAFCGDIVQRLGQQGFAARAAIADTVGCAWAVARFFYPPLQGEGRIAEGNPPPGQVPGPITGPPPGSLREPTSPLQGEVSKNHTSSFLRTAPARHCCPCGLRHCASRPASRPPWGRPVSNPLPM
jgi:protein ImuB